ncbi:hypothetical protein [Shinella sp. DD12]|nr:hypothetical protein [Shinella sp. DD12]EYR81842.1 hypothetical protein SHLA_4c001330 [Shinella sp. DD12]
MKTTTFSLRGIETVVMRGDGGTIFHRGVDIGAIRRGPGPIKI